MSSPFSTIEEFNNVLEGPTEGAIYTFAGSPMINNLALLASVGIFIWFIVKTYRSHAKPSSFDKSMNTLSSFIVIGLLSLVAVAHRQQGQPPAEQVVAENSAPTRMVSHSDTRRLPLGFLGAMNLGLPTFGFLKNRHKSRAYRRYRARR